MCPCYRSLTGPWIGYSLAWVIKENYQGIEKKCKKVLLWCFAPRSVPATVDVQMRLSRGLLMSCVFSGNCCVLKVNDSDVREGSTMGTEFVSLGTASSRRNMRENPLRYQLLHLHPVSTGREQSDAQAPASGRCMSSVGGKYPPSLSKIRKITENRADIPPHMLL